MNRINAGEGMTTAYAGLVTRGNRSFTLRWQAAHRACTDSDRRHVVSRLWNQGTHGMRPRARWPAPAPTVRPEQAWVRPSTVGRTQYSRGPHRWATHRAPPHGLVVVHTVGLHHQCSPCLCRPCGLRIHREVGTVPAIDRHVGVSTSVDRGRRRPIRPLPVPLWADSHPSDPGCLNPPPPPIPGVHPGIGGQLPRLWAAWWAAG